MVSLSTFSCGRDVMFLRRASSTAVVVSDLRQWDCQNGFSLIPVIQYMHIFQFPDSRCRPQVSLSNNLKPFQRCRGEKHKLCRYGTGMAKSTGGLAPRHRQRPPTHRDPVFFFARARKSPKTEDRHSIHYSSRCPEKYMYMYLIGDIAMVIVKYAGECPIMFLNDD